jgi:hypothetical protein
MARAAARAARSARAFAMTEPAVASSATRPTSSPRSRRDGDRLRDQRPQVVHLRRRLTRAARSSSSWARPTRTAPTGISSSR